MRTRGSRWRVRAVLGTVALTAASAPEVRPAPVFGSGIHERITRNAFPFMTSGVLSVIVAGNLDEDQGVAADSGHRHAQNCQFRAGAAYANLRYGQVVAALREPSTSDPDRAARLFGHILHGAQDFYSHSNWIPTPPQGLGLRDRILDSGLGTWTQPVPYSTLFGDVVVIEGDPPAGVTVRLPADAAGRVAGAVPIVQDRRVGGNRRGVRGLMTSGAPRHPGDQLCPPVSAPCDIATPANVCLRHGDSRSSGTSSRNFDGAGRMNLDGDGGGDWFEARRHAVLQTRHEWCRLLHLSRDLDPSFVASGRLLGNWVGTDAGTNTPHIPGTPCQRGATRRHHVEITATPGSNAPSTVPFVVFRSDFTSSARAPTLARGATKTLGICANTNENVVAALIPARARGALIVVPVTGAAESRTFRDHRGAFTVTYTIRVTPNSC